MDSDGYVVLFVQEFGDLRAAEGGLVIVGIEGSAERGWSVAYASSTASRDTGLAASPSLSATEAWVRAAASVGRDVSDEDIGPVSRDREWAVFTVDGFSMRQRARPVAVPTPTEGVRPAFDALVIDGDSMAFQVFVDAQSGAVLLRKNLVDHQVPEPVPYPPKWEVFPAYPKLGNQTFPWNYPNDDIRETWCWESTTPSPTGGPPVRDPECDREVQNLASRAPWDYDVRADAPTFTTRGNNAFTAEAWYSSFTPAPTHYQPVSPEREYIYPWNNEWFNTQPPGTRPNGCFPEFVYGVTPDVPAAVTNLFVQHNRMHDWNYFLGFTERHWNAQDHNFGTGGTADGDPLRGDVQAGAVDGGPPSYTGRDNANMITLPDGVTPITNMYLWQPIAGAFYAPCVDGDFDMAVIGHEYGHLTENRMIGKGNRRFGHHAGAMGESFGDFSAVEYLNEYGFTPVSGENPFAVGPYVTANHDRAIRNYNMSWPRTGGFPRPGVAPKVNPLNFSDMGYDIVHQQVHANGEIWSATNFDIRQAMVKRYGAGTQRNQELCADGKLPVKQCPGNRRWIQIVFDAMLLMPTEPSMLQARDAYLAADRMRFGGANQRLLWNVFARRGFGQNAASTNSSPDGFAEEGEDRREFETDPTPNFESKVATNEARVRFRTKNAATGANAPARIFVGHYEARVSPIADTDPSTTAPRDRAAAGNNLDNVARFMPGRYEFTVQADGYGIQRFALTLRSRQTRTVTLRLLPNVASIHRGARAFGDGEQHDNLIDDTEATNWDDPAGDDPVNVVKPQVTVDLAGSRPVTIDRVNVSAMLVTVDRPFPQSPSTQNRWTALRQFEIWACNAATGAACASSASASATTAGFNKVFTSAPNAFPGFNPRPLGPQMILRSFDIPNVSATHLRIVVLHNQCTGDPDFHGDQDADPANPTDCRLGGGLLAGRQNEVHIAELQAFGRVPGVVRRPGHDDDGRDDDDDDDDDDVVGPIVRISRT